MYICNVTNIKQYMCSTADYEKYHEELKVKYGKDTVFYCRSMNAMMDQNGVSPEHAEKFKQIVRDWYDSSDRLDYYTGNIEKRFLEIEDSESVHKLLHEMSVYAYHLEEGSNI